MQYAFNQCLTVDKEFRLTEYGFPEVKVMVCVTLQLKFQSSQSQSSNPSFSCIKLTHLVPHLLLEKYFVAHLNVRLFLIDLD